MTPFWLVIFAIVFVPALLALGRIIAVASVAILAVALVLAAIMSILPGAPRDPTIPLDRDIGRMEADIKGCDSWHSPISCYASAGAYSCDNSECYDKLIAKVSDDCTSDVCRNGLAIATRKHASIWADDAFRKEYLSHPFGWHTQQAEAEHDAAVAAHDEEIYAERRARARSQ